MHALYLPPGATDAVCCVPGFSLSLSSRVGRRSSGATRARGGDAPHVYIYCTLEFPLDMMCHLIMRVPNERAGIHT